MGMRFQDRIEAGQRLARHLGPEWIASANDLIVLGLPRGGVPVAAEVARVLGAELDVFVARKIGAPGQEELGIGAIAEGSDQVVATGIATVLGIEVEELERLAADRRVELNRRVELYRQGRPLPSLRGRDVILVDDGLATGVTAEAALRALRTQGPRRLLLAVPVCAPDTRERLEELADGLVCLVTPEHFRAVGVWYERFEQTTDQEVLELLSHSPRVS